MSLRQMEQSEEVSLEKENLTWVLDEWLARDELLSKQKIKNGLAKGGRQEYNIFKLKTT